MTKTDTDRDGSHSGRSGAATRRRFLKSAATAGIAAAGVGGAATSTSAQLFGGPEVISVDGGWFGSWSAGGSFPVADELLVFVHGWFGDTTVSSQASDVQNSLESGGYSPEESVAIEWPATTINFAGAEGDTENVGEVTAGLAEDFYDAGGGNIRLVGHSLGGRCVLWTITKLSGSYEIETVAPLGAAADGSEVCGSPWNTGLSKACEVRNYHSGNDSTVGAAYGGFGDTALGTDGAGCTPASNYTDVDVTWDVGSHLDHLGNSGVGDDLASAINSGSCDGSGTGGSGGSTGGLTGGSSGSWGGWGSGGSTGGSASSGGGLWGSGGSAGGTSGGVGWF